MSLIVNPNANVTLTFEGLAIYNLNKETNNWEFLFLRHLENHELRVNITRRRTTPGHAGDSNLIHSFTISKEHNILIDAGDSLATPDGKFRYEIPDFAYKFATQKEDIRWMEESSGEEGEVHTMCSFNSQFSKKNLSFLSIGGQSILYTQKLSEIEFEIWEKRKETREEGTFEIRKLLASRPIGLVIGADIQYPVGKSIKFSIEGLNGFTLELPIAPDSHYEISFNNSCDGKPDCPNLSDFQFYYDLLVSSTGSEIDIIPAPVLASDGTMKPGDTAACICKTCKNLVGFTSLREMVN